MKNNNTGDIPFTPLIQISVHGIPPRIIKSATCLNISYYTIRLYIIDKHVRQTMKQVIYSEVSNKGHSDKGTMY